MNDQATTLRTIANNNNMAVKLTQGTVESVKQRRCVAITGGKGGVGKSNLAVNLALELGLLVDRVALLDADFGLANVDLLCGVLPTFHLGHVVAGLKELSEITIDLSDNVALIPGGSGVEELANLSISAKPGLFAQVHAMEEKLSFMLIDTAAGIAENVSSVLASASEIIVVVTPEPTSIVDAYATIKVILRTAVNKPLYIVINNVVGIGDAEQVFQSISSAVRGFLDFEVQFLGMIPHDPQVKEAVREQVPVVRYAPDSPASRAIRLIAKQLRKQKVDGSEQEGIHSFWDSLAKQ
jgi:flagellar biosynthesis protein FlhG